MKWGLGSPRSGTVALATMLGGAHEPMPRITREVFSYYSEGELGEDLIAKVQQRAALEAPIIVDPLHSFIVPVIRAIDREASFVVMVRDPIACVRSLVARGTYVIGTPGNRWRQRPPQWPEDAGVVFKCAWYWREVYRAAVPALRGAEVKWKRTEELPDRMRLNVDDRSSALELTDEERAEIAEVTADALELIEQEAGWR